MDNEKRKFEFRYCKRIFLPFVIFALIWAAITYGAYLIWPSTSVTLGGVEISRTGNPISMAVAFGSLPLVWAVVHKRFERKGVGILHNNRVVIILEEQRYDIPYRRITNVVTLGKGVSTWYIFLKDGNEIRIDASMGFKGWRKSLTRFMIALRKDIKGKSK